MCHWWVWVSEILCFMLIRRSVASRQLWCGRSWHVYSILSVLTKLQLHWEWEQNAAYNVAIPFPPSSSSLCFSCLWIWSKIGLVRNSRFQLVLFLLLSKLGVTRFPSCDWCHTSSIVLLKLSDSARQNCWKALNSSRISLLPLVWKCSDLRVMSYWLSIIQLVEKLKVGCQACAAVGVLFSGQCDISHT